MARPYKTGIDYFPLDVDFFVDDKMIAIAGEFGIKGEVAVIHLLCAIYRNGYYVEWNDRLRSKLDRELPGVSVDLLCMIVDRLVRWEFFDKSLFYSSSILTSKGIQRRYSKPFASARATSHLYPICSSAFRGSPSRPQLRHHSVPLTNQLQRIQESSHHGPFLFHSRNQPHRPCSLSFWVTTRIPNALISSFPTRTEPT